MSETAQIVACEFGDWEARTRGRAYRKLLVLLKARSPAGTWGICLRLRARRGARTIVRWMSEDGRRNPWCLYGTRR